MIPYSNPFAQYRNCKQDILDAIERVLESGNYILGNEVKNFEKSFAKYCGSTCAIGLNSGTDALLLSLRAMNIGHGDEVITVSHTAPATISAIIASGAKAVLVDINPKYYTLDTQCLKKAITSKTKAVIPVHLYGQASDIDSIMKIARTHNIFVIEDCAQSAGGTYKDNRLGSIGDIGCFSFYPTKNLGAIGDGGMIVTNNDEFAERIVRLRQYGWDEKRISKEAGINSRLDEIQAAILSVKLKNLDKDNSRRREIAEMYNQGLADLPIILPAQRSDSEHVYHLYVIASKKRDKLKRHLEDNRIFTGIHYPYPLHHQKAYSNNLISVPFELKNTEILANQILSLPLFPELTNQEIEDVVNVITRYI